MEFDLPDSAFVEKFIAKSKFFDKTVVNSRIKNEFINKIQKITWKWKLSESTINTKKTKAVEEIQIFEIELKQQEIPQNILKLINKTIPYPILYILRFESHFITGMALQDGLNQIYYFSEWDETKQFDFTGINLEKIYEKLIKSFIVRIEKKGKTFQEIVETNQRIKTLEREIQALKNKVRKEKQPSRQLELNQQLNTKKKELDKLI